MATISRQFDLSDKFTSVGSSERRIDFYLPTRTVTEHPDSLAPWLLPPEPVRGFEAVVQATSKASGIMLFLAAVGAVAWILIG